MSLRTFGRWGGLWLLGFFAMSAQAASPLSPAFDGWRAANMSSKLNPLFSEFKYFNFQDAEISGAITYAVASPLLTRVISVTAQFFEGGRVWSMRKTYPLSCVKYSAKSLSTDLCGEGRIEVQNWDASQVSVRVVQERGPLRWDFVLKASASQITDQITHIPLSGPDMIQWMMDWSPVTRSGQVNGEVRLVDRTYTLDTQTSYHDQNWETWYPKWQPFNWFHFTAPDSSGERVDVTLVEFPKNNGTQVGLTIYQRGIKRLWPQGTYRIVPIGNGFIPITRLSRPQDFSLSQRQMSINDLAGERLIPLGYRIETTDGQIRLNLMVQYAVSTSNEEEAVSPGSDETVVDELIVLSKVQFLSVDGTVRSAEGRGEFMSTATLQKQ